MYFGKKGLGKRRQRDQFDHQLKKKTLEISFPLRCEIKLRLGPESPRPSETLDRAIIFKDFV